MTYSSSKFIKPVIFVLMAALLCTLVILSFKPGHMNIDTFSILEEARAGRLSDWNPPAMATVWRIFDMIWPSPTVMLLFHNLMFFTGLGLIAFFGFEKLEFKNSAIFVVAINPVVLIYLGTIWKCAGLGSSLCLGFALTMIASKKKKPVYLLLALPFTFYACLVRWEAIFTVFPLLFWAAYILIAKSSQKHHWFRVFLTGSALTILFAFSKLAFDFVMITDRSYPESQIFMLDLAAMSINKGKMVVPPTHLKPGTDLEFLRTQFKEDDMVGLDDKALEAYNEPNPYKTLFWSWLRELRQDPLIYLYGRSRVYLGLAGITRKEVCFPYQWGIEPNNFGFKEEWGPLHAPIMKFVEAAKDSVLFRAFFYLLLDVIFLLVFWIFPRLRSPFFLTLVVSSITYQCSLFFLSLTCAVRMIWWSMLATTIAAIWLGVTLVSEKTSLDRNALS